MQLIPEKWSYFHFPARAGRRDRNQETNQRAPSLRRTRVNQRKMRWMMLAFVLMAIMTLGACKKKVAPPPPPPPSPPPAATASLSDSTNNIDKGGDTTLT